MSDRPDYRSGDASPWISFRELFVAVVLLSILPYFSRDTAQSLGLWTVIAPGVAFWLAVFGGALVLFEWRRDGPPGQSYRQQRLTWQPADSPRRAYATQLLRAALLSTLVVGAGLNTWAVATSWAQGRPKAAEQTTAESDASDLNAITASPGVQQLTKTGGAKSLPSAPNLKVMLRYITGMLSQARCTATRDPADPPFTSAFVCTVTANKTPRWPRCRFIWSISPVYANGRLATVESRVDVVTKFKKSGYGKFGPPGVKPSTAPYLGVAFVACGKGAARTGKANLRVAFVLSNASQITKYSSGFRTVGFDWIQADHLAKPYVAELFSLASLYKVTQIISTAKEKFTQTMTSSAHDDLFDVKALDALRRIQSGSIRVGNRSDGQLGNSRGSCLLVAAASGLSRDSLRVHIAPSAVTSGLAAADRSLVLLPPTKPAVSLPCTLVSALITRDMSQANNYPAALTGTTLRYRVTKGESKQDAQRAAYDIRAAGLTLYLLGFEVTYDRARTPPQVVGSWPRTAFVAAKKIP
jgi:hypothetical protein